MMQKFLVLLPFMAFLAAGAQKAPVRAPAKKPAPARTPPPDDAMNAPPRTFLLNNGMRVTLIHTGTVRKAAIALVLQTGQIDEPSFGAGLAAMTADILLEGSVARPAKQIVAEAASMGTTLSVRAAPISTTLSGEVETSLIPHFLSLTADVVRHPLLDTAGFGRVRRNALRILDSTLHNPTDLARQQFRAIIFPDGPFGRPYAFGPMLSQLKLGHVRNVYDDFYSAAHAHLYISGVFNDAATEAVVRDIFSDWKAGLPPKPHSVAAVTVHELVTVDQPAAAHSVIWIGLPTIDPADSDYPKLEVANMLIGGDDSSRVAKHLSFIEGVPEHGGSSLWERRGASYWVDEMDVRTGDTGSALAALIGEIAALVKTAPPEADIARARKRVIAAFAARQSTRDGLIDEMEFMDEHSLGEGWRKDYVKRVMAVTPEDVSTTVALHLNPEKMAIVIVGDRAAVDPQLAKLRPMVP